MPCADMGFGVVRGGRAGCGKGFRGGWGTNGAPGVKTHGPEAGVPKLALTGVVRFTKLVTVPQDQSRIDCWPIS